MTTVGCGAKLLLRAGHDARSAAVLDQLVALHYQASAAPAGLPGYVRAASALRRFRSRLVIVQDDVDALAVRGSNGYVAAVTLRREGVSGLRFDAETGNKHAKMDLEACVVLRAALVGFGSGSLPVRERIVVWDGAGQPRVHDAGRLYAELRAALEMPDAQVNIEGAVVRGDELLLFHRGNGAGVQANAVFELRADEFDRYLAGAPVPRIRRVTYVDLGAVDGTQFGFTDAVVVAPGVLIVLACAERSESALTDGDVLGCRVGVWTSAGLRLVDVRDEAGRVSRLKLEGIEPRPGRTDTFDVVVDGDSSAQPARLGRLSWRWQ